MSHSPAKGLLIAFEGIDGAGKSTQASAVSEKLNALGYDSIYLREPTHGPYGMRLRQLMIAGRDSVSPEEEFRLFLADRQEDVELNIAPALSRGAIVCVDRYYISSMAYQGALGLDPEYIRRENEKIAPRPNLVLYFWLPVEEAVGRIRKSRRGGQNLFEVEAYQRRVSQVFDSITNPPLVRLDATTEPKSLTDQATELILKLKKSGSQS